MGWKPKQGDGTGHGVRECLFRQTFVKTIPSFSDFPDADGIGSHVGNSWSGRVFVFKVDGALKPEGFWGIFGVDAVFDVDCGAPAFGWVVLETVP